MYDIEKINSKLTGSRLNYRLLAFDELNSTSTRLKALAAEGAPEGTVVLAERQSTGRGRIGKSFLSPEGGLYISLLLRPAAGAADAALLTAVAAVAAVSAVERVCGLRAGIKWVNDIIYGGKKLCGILAESVLSGGETGPLVLGIGINANIDMSGFPPELQQIVTSTLQETGRRVCLETLAAELLKTIGELYGGFPGNIARVHELYSERLYTLSQRVTIVGGTGEQFSVVGLDERFGLVIQGEDGAKQTLRSGEVSVKAALQQQ